MDNITRTRPARRRILSLGTSVTALLFPACAGAYETTIDGWQVSIDTTLSSSAAVRTSPQSPAFIGIPNGGRLGLANNDDGDLNFKSGSFVAAQQRVTSEVQIKQDDYGFFIRGTAFIDPVSNGIEY